MIKTQDLTPRVYYNMSRDFQLIGRLYDVVLNAVKTDADLIYSLPIGDNTDIALVTLLSTTLGFVPKHKYNSKQLSAICNVLSYIIRNKGSLEAITIAVNALLNAEGIVDYLDYTYKDGLLTLYIPEILSDLTLLNDLMDYITPAGVGYNLVKEMKYTLNVDTILETDDEFTFITESSSNYGTKNTALSRNANIDASDIADIDISNKCGANVNMSILTPQEIEDIIKENK